MFIVKNTKMEQFCKKKFIEIETIHLMNHGTSLLVKTDLNIVMFSLISNSVLLNMN